MMISLNILAQNVGLNSMISYKWYLKDLNDIPKNNYKVFSCFACGGGSSMGYKLAGYEVVGDCEIDKDMNDTYLANFKPKYNYLMGVQDFYKLNNLPEELYNIDILDGSPPCSTFSFAGQREKVWGVNKKFREGQQEQVLSDLFFEYIKVAERLKPKIIVAENVKGLICGNAKGYVNKIIKEFNRIGYDTQIFLLNMAKMGVPQKRERVFFICRRKDLNLPKIKLDFDEKPITYGEIRTEKGIPINKNTKAYELWKHRLPTDKDLGDVSKRIVGKGNCFSIQILKDNCVCNTITANGDRYMRYLTPERMSDEDIITCQTFPQDYNFNGQNIQYICGMSVPPIAIYKIAVEIKSQLLDKIKGN